LSKQGDSFFLFLSNGIPFPPQHSHPVEPPRLFATTCSSVLFPPFFFDLTRSMPPTSLSTWCKFLFRSRMKPYAVPPGKTPPDKRTLVKFSIQPRCSLVWSLNDNNAVRTFVLPDLIPAFFWAKNTPPGWPTMRRRFLQQNSSPFFPHIHSFPNMDPRQIKG